jgi:hypothetical protein
MTARLRHDFQTSYYDPFQAFLYPSQLAPYLDLALPSETLALFAPFAYGSSEGVKGWLGALLVRQLRQWWIGLAGVDEVLGYIPT